MKTNIIYYFRAFLRSFITGILIAIGGIVYLSCDNKYVGAFLFGTGLFTILTFGFDLFTGKVGYAVNEKPKYLLYLLTVWIGNLAGTFFAACIILQTRFGDALNQKARDLVSVKTADSPASLLVLGFFCGMLMFIAADGYKNGKTPVIQALSIFLPVMTFILAGFEHSVADMFYVAISGLWNAPSWIALLIISTGNAIGGITIPIIRKLVKNDGDNK